MDANQTAVYILAIEEEIKNNNIINKFQDWLISTIYNLEAEGSTSETWDMNTRYKYSMSALEHYSGLE